VDDLRLLGLSPMKYLKEKSYVIYLTQLVIALLFPIYLSKEAFFDLCHFVQILNPLFGLNHQTLHKKQVL